MIQQRPHNPKSIPWIILGSSPNAQASYRKACADHVERVTITSNRGILIEPEPDFYFLSDRSACANWAGNAREADKRGTCCVTLQRNDRALDARGIAWFPVKLRGGHPFEPFQLSGLACVEIAIRLGKARQVILCGMDGYDPERGIYDYFDGEEHSHKYKARGCDHTETIIEPVTNLLCRKYPSVDFLCYGAPRYAVTAPNWSVIGCTLTQ